MSDDADRADARIQQVIDDGIKQASKLASERSLIAIGTCYWCESPVGPARLFCSKECCDDHEHARLRRKALGR